MASGRVQDDHPARRRR